MKSLMLIIRVKCKNLIVHEIIKNDKLHHKQKLKIIHIKG